jgi:CubicO group peptidase (beta-lactamase class C family)
MTSGVNYNLANSSVDDFKERTGGRCPTLEFPAAIAKEPLEFDPGERWCYGLSLDIIGALVELVSGKKLGEYMKENIFDPLGMKNTSFGFTDEKLDKMATQYRFDPETCSAVEIPKKQNQFVLGTEYESGGAGLISCVDDQILLTDALTHLGLGANGNRILSERAVNLMRSDALTDSVRRSFAPPHFLGYSYGYGVRVNYNPSSVGNLAPIGEFGWDGAKMSYISCDPENKVSMFHAEHMGGVASIVWPKLRNLLYSSLDY